MSAFLGVGIGLVVLVFVKPEHISLLSASVWLLGSSLVVSIVIIGAMTWYRSLCTDPKARHSASVLLHSYLYALLAVDIAVLALIGYLLLQQNEIVWGAFCLLISGAALIPHWRITASLLELTHRDR